MRIDIQPELRSLLNSGESFSRPHSINEALSALQARRAAPASTDRFRQALATLHRATYGMDASAEAQEAADGATLFLAELRERST